MAVENEDRFVRLLKQQAGEVALDQNRREIEQAIDRAKRNVADKALTKQFFRSEARSRWSDRRWRRYSEWLRKQDEEREGRRGQDQEERQLREEAERRPSGDWWRLGPMGRLQRRESMGRQDP